MKLKLLFLTGLALLCVACTAPFAPKFPSTERYSPVSYSYAQDALERYSRQVDQIQSLRALADGKLLTKVGSSDFRQAIVFLKPYFLRLDILASRLNRPLGIMLLDRSVVTYLDTRQKKAYRVLASPRNIEKLLSVPLGGKELMNWFAALATIPPKEELKYCKLYSDGTAYIIKCHLTDGRRLSVKLLDRGFWISTEALEISSDNNTFYSRFYYSDLNEMSGEHGETDSRILLPAKIEAWISGKKIKIEYNFSKSEITPNLENLEKVFYLRIPDSYSVYGNSSL